MQQRLNLSRRPIAVWGWVGPAVLALILVSAVGAAPLYAMNQSQPDPLSSPVASPSPTTTVSSDKITFTADTNKVKSGAIPAGADAKVDRTYDLELPKETGKCEVRSNDNSTGDLSEGPFACSVKIKDGKLTGVNGPLTQGLASGTLEFSTKEDGDFVVAFQINLNPLSSDNPTTKTFIAAAGTEKEDKKEDKVSNSVGFDPKASTVSVTPIMNAGGDTSAFTLKVDLTLVEKTSAP